MYFSLSLYIIIVQISIPHIKKGKGFDLEDFKEQLKQMQNMGGVASIMEKMPGMGALPPGAASQVDDSQFRRMEAIINSMTPRERLNPELLNGSRKRRITQGSGTQIQDLNRLLKQHKQMQTIQSMISMMLFKHYYQNKQILDRIKID